MKRAVIILPTYIEKDNLKDLIPKIFEVVKTVKGWEIEILVVDDNSPDKTTDLIKLFKKKYTKLHLISHKKAGLGKAYLRGFSYAIGKLHPDVIFEMDADWSHDPSLIPEFIKKIDEGSDFVIGSRYIKGGSIPTDWSFDRKILSWVGNLIVRLGFMSPNIHDWTSGFRAIKSFFIKDALGQMQDYNGYVFQVALLDRAKKQGLKITEVPLNFIDRKLGYSKINALQYSMNTISYVFTKSSFIKYFLVGIIGASLDFGISFILIEKLYMKIWISTIISSQIAIISNFILNNFWSFSHKKIDNKITAYVSNFAKFNFVAVGAIFIQVVCLHILTTLFPKKLWYIYKAFVIGFLVIPYSYFMYNSIIWREKT